MARLAEARQLRRASSPPMRENAQNCHADALGRCSPRSTTPRASTPGLRLRAEVRRDTRDRGDRAACRPRARQRAPAVQIYSRLGNQKTAQFPELVQGFEQIGRTLGRRLDASTARSSRSTKQANPRVSAAAGAHAPDGRRRHPRVLKARSRSRSSPSICCATATRTRGRARGPTAARASRPGSASWRPLTAPAAQRGRARRRPRPRRAARTTKAGKA